MKRYSFDGSCRGQRRAWYGFVALALLFGSVPAHAARTVPDALRLADAGVDDTRILSPTEVEDGLRIRIEGMEIRRGSREAEPARDYGLDEAPPAADVPLPADASGGEIFEERLEDLR